MRTITTLLLLTGALCAAACNTVRGAGEDARSIGRVFSHDPNGDHRDQR